MTKIRLIVLQLIVILLCLSGCTSRQTNTPAFYVWKSKLTAQDADTAYLHTLGAQKLYIRMFDVTDQGDGAFPTADYTPAGNFSFSQEVVPVIFITNKTMLQCPPEEIKELARKCVDKIDTTYHTYFNKYPTEYQFDCDWTGKTQANYFHFLSSIRELRKEARTSCTIRLHQIKFKDKTGVPPVDKGTLMYYASSEPTDFTNKNTLLNNKEAASYIGDINSYPLHLDIALPLYSWGLVRNPFGQIKLINGVRQATIDAQPGYYMQTGEGVYRILQSHYLKGIWVNKDYELKVEEVSLATLQEAAKLLRKKLPKENREIIFYHLDEDILKQYPTEQLKNIINLLS